MTRADADVVVGQTGQAGDDGTVGVGCNHASGGSEAGRAVCHLVVVGTVGVPSDGELHVGLWNSGVKPDVEDATRSADAADVQREAVVGVDGAVGVEVDGERSVGGEQGADCARGSVLR